MIDESQKCAERELYQYINGFFCIEASSITKLQCSKMYKITCSKVFDMATTKIMAPQLIMQRKSWVDETYSLRSTAIWIKYIINIGFQGLANESDSHGIHLGTFTYDEFGEPLHCSLSQSLYVYTNIFSLIFVQLN